MGGGGVPGSLPSPVVRSHNLVVCTCLKTISLKVKSDYLAVQISLTTGLGSYPEDYGDLLRAPEEILGDAFCKTFS